MGRVSKSFQSTGYSSCLSQRRSSLSLSLSLHVCSLQNGEKRLLAFTKRGRTIHSVSACPFYLHVASFVILIRSVDATPIVTVFLPPGIC